MSRKHQQPANTRIDPSLPNVRGVSVGQGGAVAREAGDPPLTRAQIQHLRSHGIDIASDDAEGWTFIEPEVTVECDLDQAWRVSVIVAPQDGSPVVTQCEIHPKEPTTPRGGLRTRALRRVKLEEALTAARQALHEIGAEDASALQRWQGFRSERLDTSPRKRRTSRYSDRYCAEVAAAYVDALKRRCKAPRRDVVERMSRETGVGCSEEHVRDVLGVARERGLLSPAQRSVARGHLTAKGNAALSD